MTQQSNQTPTVAQPTQSERFTRMVMAEFSATSGSLEITARQKRLIQSYFISIDQALKTAETFRLKKAEKYRDKLPVIWANVNMEQLAIKVMAYSRIGFDPSIANHINMIPFKNNTTNKYEITFIEGYRGKQLKAIKYGYDMPNDIIVELVYSTDVFKPLKKDINNPIESYKFEVVDSFNRGEIIGGFYYFNYLETPQKNKLMFYSKAEIEKRKPEKASAEFWGGDKPTWGEDNDGKSVKTGTEHVEGWYTEMMWKTLMRIAFNNILIDSEKIDDDFMKVIESERDFSRIENTTPNDANSQTLDIDSEEVPPTTQSLPNSIPVNLSVDNVPAEQMQPQGAATPPLNATTEKFKSNF